MKKMTIDEIKACELEILIYIDEICKSNDIQYFLAYGTLIGAIRHNGFIPWDDDIDIVMKRNEYEKFLKLFHNTNKYKILEINKNDDYYYPFAKVVDLGTTVIENDFKVIKDLGVWVDVFPLDYYEEHSMKIDYIENLKKKLLLSRSVHFIKTKKPLKTILKYIGFILYRRKEPKKYGVFLNELGCNSKLPTNELCVLFPPNIKKNIFKTCWYDDAILYNFEGHSFFIPKEYDAILTSYYGDYMKLPPVNQRNSGHNIDAFFKD